MRSWQEPGAGRSPCPPRNLAPAAQVEGNQVRTRTARQLYRAWPGCCTVCRAAQVALDCQPKLHQILDVVDGVAGLSEPFGGADTHLFGRRQPARGDADEERHCVGVGRGRERCGPRALAQSPQPDGRLSDTTPQESRSRQCILSLHLQGDVVPVRGRATVEAQHRNPLRRQNLTEVPVEEVRPFTGLRSMQDHHAGTGWPVGQRQGRRQLDTMGANSQFHGSTQPKFPSRSQLVSALRIGAEAHRSRRRPNGERP